MLFNLENTDTGKCIAEYSFVEIFAAIKNVYYNTEKLI